MSKPVLRIEEKGTPLTHAECGGEIHSIEAVYIYYEVVSDGLGGFDYTGNSKMGESVEWIDCHFECRVCGKYDDHFNVVIKGTEVKFK